MRIGIDASRATRRHRTGTENYTLYLLRALLTLDRSTMRHQFHLYFNEPPEPGLFPSVRHAQQRVMRFPRLWTQVRLALEVQVRRPDVLFVPAHVLPLLHPRRCVATIHDLGYLIYPETYRRWDLWYLKVFTAFTARAATVIIADSHHTKGDVVRRFNLEEERVLVAHPGAAEEFRPEPLPGEQEYLAERYGLTEDYLLYVGTLHPRKNIKRLLEAFALAHQAEGFSARLVLAGRKGWLPEEIIEALQPVRQWVTLTGFVPPADLPALMRQARALILPSLFEGFGLPVVEAMACGTPIVASRAGALPEVVAEAALLVNPRDTGEIAQSLHAVWSDHDLRERLRAAGLDRARDFTWEQTARTTLEALEMAAAL